MMQATYHRNRDQLALLFNFSFNRRIPIQRKMCSVLVIVFKIRMKNAAQVTFVQDDEVVQTLAAQ